MDDIGNHEDAINATNILELKTTQSDVYVHKQIVTDKLVANCVESLIGTYVNVSVNYNNKILAINCNCLI